MPTDDPNIHPMTRRVALSRITLGENSTIQIDRNTGHAVKQGIELHKLSADQYEAIRTLQTQIPASARSGVRLEYQYSFDFRNPVEVHNTQFTSVTSGIHGRLQLDFRGSRSVHELSPSHPVGALAHLTGSHIEGSHVFDELMHKLKIKQLNGVASGLAGAVIASTMEAHKGVESAIKAGQEAILPESTTSGTNICKITGVVVGGVAGVLAAGAAGGATLALATPTTSPFISVPVTALVGAATYSAVQPVVKLGTEASCDRVADSVKQLASKLSSITLGGNETVAQNTYKEPTPRGKGAKL